MFGIIKKILIVLLSNIVNTKFVSLNNQKCMISPALFNLHPNEYSQEFHYCPLANYCDCILKICVDEHGKPCASEITADLKRACGFLPFSH